MNDGTYMCNCHYKTILASLNGVFGKITNLDNIEKEM